jgi:hypothetical protein
MNTVTSSTPFGGAGWCLGGFNGPALDQNQSPLPSSFHHRACSLVHFLPLLTRVVTRARIFMFLPFLCISPLFTQKHFTPPLCALPCIHLCSQYLCHARQLANSTRSAAYLPITQFLLGFEPFRACVNQQYFFVSRSARSASHRREPCCSTHCCAI